MQNAELWRPSKFVRDEKKGLRPSPDPKELGIRSRLIGRQVAEAYWRVLRKHAKGTLADIGCGKVPLYDAYRDLVGEVICIDWENSLHANSHVDIKANLNAGLPLPDDRLDTLLATDVLEHLRHPDVFWSEAARVLRPGGRVILGVPFLYWIHEQPHDHFRYTEFALREACSSQALELLELEPYGGPLSVVLDVIGKNLPGNRLARWYQAWAMWLVGTRLGRRIDARNARLFPLGYSLVAQKHG